MAVAVAPRTATQLRRCSLRYLGRIIFAYDVRARGDVVPPAIISRDRGATGDHRWPGRKKRVYVRIMSVEKVDVRATTMRARASTSGVQISADR